MYFFRPAPGWSQYRTPIDGYYQCGSGTHPGGCVIGSPGRLASQRILKDLADPSSNELSEPRTAGAAHNTDNSAAGESRLPVSHLFGAVCHDEGTHTTGGTSMQLELSAEDAAFRDEMRTFFTTEVPQEIRDAVAERRELTKEQIVEPPAGRSTPPGSPCRTGPRSGAAEDWSPLRATSGTRRCSAPACRRRWRSTPRWSAR